MSIPSWAGRDPYLLSRLQEMEAQLHSKRERTAYLEGRVRALESAYKAFQDGYEKAAARQGVAPWSAEELATLLTKILDRLDRIETAVEKREDG